MFNKSLTIANLMQSNITNSMRNNIVSISLMSNIGNHNFNILDKMNVPIKEQNINPIICNKSKCGSIKNNLLFFQFCQ